MDDVQFTWRGRFDDTDVQRLHDAAFGVDLRSEPDTWSDAVHAHSLGWVTAARRGRLVGFVNVITDGLAHAWLQDVVVDPDHQRGGIGGRMVDLAAEAAAAAGCEWLHVDFDDDVADFYLGRCGFRPTAAGLRYLS